MSLLFQVRANLDIGEKRKGNKRAMGRGEKLLIGKHCLKKDGAKQKRKRVKNGAAHEVKSNQRTVRPKKCRTCSLRQIGA